MQSENARSVANLFCSSNRKLLGTSCKLEFFLDKVSTYVLSCQGKEALKNSVDNLLYPREKYTDCLTTGKQPDYQFYNWMINFKPLVKRWAISI